MEDPLRGSRQAKNIIKGYFVFCFVLLVVFGGKLNLSCVKEVNESHSLAIVGRGQAFAFVYVICEDMLPNVKNI